MSHGNPSKGLGVLQLWKAHAKERESPSATIGTRQIQALTPLALKD